MARRLLALAALWVAVGLGVVAADFWEEKPFRSWSDGETNKILTDSPWADEIAVALPPQLSSSAGGGTGGVSSPAAGGGGGGAAPQRARGRESFSNVSRVRMSVSWRSALPVKQALLREQVGEGWRTLPRERGVSGARCWVLYHRRAGRADAVRPHPNRPGPSFELPRAQRQAAHSGRRRPLPARTGRPPVARGVP